ncbi:amidohydrolase family protein [Parvularcula marina]|uniref:Amidohydrolase n=2 Tax=Parvularcula marina TaxID=2292771 RepID=A0A371RK88_9PROT|nr:amidohydrolase family protein [Parvularcula marina]RFB05861.1 amidohydrolase [Parvularcula marina]
MKKLLLSTALAALFALPAVAQEAGQGTENEEKKDEKWDVANPPLPMREVTINVDEGTWMNVDVSPDGRMLAFDLLGDIYTMPISGGTPTRIAEGMPWEMQPKFSPDGEMIAFTSDREGGDNIWVMNVDGSDKRSITSEKFRLLNEPDWSPDGTYIAARKHFTTARSLGTGEVWLYHLGGGGGVALVEKPGSSYQKELGEPVFSPDGGSIYYTRSTSGGNTFVYADDSNGEIFAIEKYDLETGDRSDVIGGAGGAVRPTPSPDGRKLAFVKRERGLSGLYVKDLRSGAITKIYDDLDQDMQETWGVHGLYPAMDWMPDSREIVFWAGGKIMRADMSGNAEVIPFTVNDTRDVIDPPRPQVEVAPDSFETRMPRYAAVSPDGNRVVFQSLGKLYVKSLSGGAPRRLTRSGDGVRELSPSWSRDGRRLVYVEWTDAELGKVKTVTASGGGARTVTNRPGHYANPVFSPNGNTIVFERGSGGYLLSDLWSDNPGIYSVPASGGEQRLVSQSGFNPQFGASNDRLFVTTGGGDGFSFVSMDMNGEAQRTHATGELVPEWEISPTGKHVAFRDNYGAYVMPLLPGPQKVGGGKGGSAVPVVKASEGGATFMSWSEDGETLNWTLGPVLYSAGLDEMVPTAPKGEDDEGYTPPESGVSLSIDVRADKPNGAVILSGAKIVTMADEDGGVIEDGVIVVQNNRIVGIGKAGEVPEPSGAKRVDVSGKTIVPGFVDAHAHGPYSDDGIVPDQNWSTIAHLALGVTTIFDPSTSYDSFAASEMQRAGMILAPRIYTTGEIVYGAKSPYRYADIQTYDDALAHVHRLKTQGAHGIKNYNQPRRDQRQQVVKAAIEENLIVVPEGGSLFTMDMSLIQDGNTSVEHNIPQRVLYEDVLSFWEQTEVAYTPTLVVTYGGLGGDPYWRYKMDVWKHPILSAHVPPHILQPSSVRSTKAPEEDFVDQYAAHQAKRLADRGIKVSIGAHGQEEGLAAHWEMWSFARGGMSPIEVLRTATVSPAQHLGFWADIGSLEEGKLADLVILDADPLEDISNTDKISYVMQNGRLYEADTMNETVTGDRQRAPYYWETSGGGVRPVGGVAHTAHQD